MQAERYEPDPSTPQSRYELVFSVFSSGSQLFVVVVLLSPGLESLSPALVRGSLKELPEPSHALLSKVVRLAPGAETRTLLIPRESQSKSLVSVAPPGVESDLERSEASSQVVAMQLVTAYSIAVVEVAPELKGSSGAFSRLRAANLLSACR